MSPELFQNSFSYTNNSTYKQSTANNIFMQAGSKMKPVKIEGEQKRISQHTSPRYMLNDQSALAGLSIENHSTTGPISLNFSSSVIQTQRITNPTVSYREPARQLYPSTSRSSGKAFMNTSLPHFSQCSNNHMPNQLHRSTLSPSKDTF